jgi:opacity protein-like surface antigen
VLNVDPQNVRETEVTTEDGNKRRLGGAWFQTGSAVKLDLADMSPVESTMGSGASSGAFSLRQWFGDSTLRFNAFGGLNLANDVRDVGETGNSSTNSLSSSKLTTNNGFSTGAGVDWKLRTGWTAAVNYQYLHEGIKGQTVQETQTSGGFSTQFPQTLIGGSLNSNVVILNFGYEWDCWKVAGKTLSLGVAGGPAWGATTFNTFNQNVSQSTTRSASGYDAQATLRYNIAGGLSVFTAYQYVHLHSDMNTSIGGGHVPIKGDLNSNVVQFGLSYALSLQPIF